jgi:glucose/arabinose dehydrogenase
MKVVRDGVRLPTPVLTLTGITTSDESGLLGLAFHPDFQSNGYFYVLCTSGATAPAGTKIIRYTLDPSNPEVADPASAYPILTILRSPGAAHQGGWMGFGPDGFLYISSGNGGDNTTSQNTNVLLGKILRIDVDHDAFPADPNANYAIPATNPFVSGGGAPEIWAYGLRNPWRCSFDRATGDLWIGDVGEASIEEIDFQPAAVVPPFPARNYGWPCMEGSQCYSSSLATCLCGDPSLILPVIEYTHNYGESVMCGYVYRGAAIPALRGTFLWGDLEGISFSCRYMNGQQLSEFAIRRSELAVGGIHSFGEDQAGELYIASAVNGVFKIIPRCAPNCDGSTGVPILNVQDFTCFFQKFATGDPYANCDGSTGTPILNVQDFTCFLQRYALGCP